MAAGDIQPHHDRTVGLGTGVAEANSCLQSGPMTRAQLALVLFVGCFALCFGLRTLVHVRRYGDTGWRFHRAARAGAVAQALLVTSIAVLLVAILVAMTADAAHEPLGVAALADTATTLGALAASLGVVLVVTGVVVMLVAQWQMGASWRIGVDTAERTQLVTGGLFRWVRNPIFSSMALVVVGEALLVPNGLAAAALVVGLVGLEAQVRGVEEPYLRATHGQAYLDWAATSGRFVPWFGRL
jgi:protein-S-isoprenylcysteine O-methyltransferase Ste14